MEKKPADDQNLQAPQDPIDKHGPKYNNDVPISSWLRNGDATTKPGFDHCKRGK